MMYSFFSIQKIFHNTTLWLRDSGILNKLYRDALNAPIIVPDPKVRVNQPLNINQLATAFMVMAGGLILGTLFFLMECYFFSIEVKRKRVNEVY